MLLLSFGLLLITAVLGSLLAALRGNRAHRAVVCPARTAARRGDGSRVVWSDRRALAYD
jgi:hypothetical protein